VDQFPGAGALSVPSWPSAEWVGGQVCLPTGIQLRQLGHADVPRVIEAIGAWSADLAIGEERVLLTSEFYDREVALAGMGQTTEDRPVLVLLLESETTLVGYLATEFDAAERALAGRLGLVAPAFRGRGYGQVLADSHAAIGRALGAHLAHGLVELDNHAQIAALERAGFALCGVLPNSEVRRVAGVARHVPEALYVSVLDSSLDLLWPEPEALEPRTAALMKLLFDFGEPGEIPATSVTGFIPELDPPVAARLAARPGGIATWPDIALLAPQLSLPGDLRLRQLARSDIPGMMALLPRWFPGLVGSSRECLLTASYYEESVALAGEDASTDRRPVYAFVIDSGAEPVAFGCGEYRAAQALLRAEIGAVAPRVRGSGLAAVMATLLVLVGRAIGADMIITWATLRHRLAQRMGERCGFRLVGIVPASDREQISPGVVKHVFEAVYAISLVPDAQTHRPPSASLSPRMASVASFILGEPGPRG
jgi:GNAT superfamily N-acetyltransferase